MSGPFYHDLHVLFPGQLGQVSQSHQFMDLRPVRGVGKTARPQSVAEAQRDIVFPDNVKESVIVFVQRVFPVVVEHPGGQKRTSPAYDIGNPPLSLQHFQGRTGQAAVNGNEINAIRALLFDNLKYLINTEVNQTPPSPPPFQPRPGKWALFPHKRWMLQE